MAMLVPMSENPPEATTTDTEPSTAGPSPEARVAAARAALGPIGVSMPTLGPTTVFPMSEQLAGVRRLEQAGYRAAWAREGVGGHDSLVELATFLGMTDSMAFGSSVANTWARPALTMHAAASVLAEAYPDRFVLGLGAGLPFHAQALGHTYARPLDRMRTYLEEMLAPREMVASAPQAYARIIAANGPRMIDLARDSADGAHPGIIPVETTSAVRQQIGPSKLLVVAMVSVPMPDRDAARDAARQAAAGMLCFPGSPYGANLARLGYTQEEMAAGSDRVLDAVLPYGGPDEIAAKAQAHLDAGADHVLVNTALPGYASGIEQFEWLAPALTSIARA